MQPPYDYRLFNYDHDLIPNVWLREEDAKEGPNLVGLSIGYPGWGLLYYSVMCHLSAERENNLLEIGTNYGACTIIMAQALIDSKRKGGVFTIEISPVNAEIAQENFYNAGTAYTTELIVGDSRSVFATRKFPKIDVAFIDGSHDYEDVRYDFDSVYQILSPDGLVIFDNTLLGGVHEALKSIHHQYHGNLIQFPYCSWSPAGMVLWTRSDNGY